MKVVVFHGSSNKLTLELNRIWILNKSKYDFKIFIGRRFFKKVVFLLNVFVCFIYYVMIILFGQM
jgi:hypothetical protein